MSSLTNTQREKKRERLREKMAVRSFCLLLVALPVIFGLLAPSCMAKIILYSGETLKTGTNLTYLSYSFVMQADCNLVLYDGSTPIWASETANAAENCVLKMQYDGNLVIYANGGADNKAVWSTGTNQIKEANYVLILQKDRNVVLYGPARWNSGTNKRGTLGVKIEAPPKNAINVEVAADAAGTATVTDLPEGEEEAIVDRNAKIAMVTEN